MAKAAAFAANQAVKNGAMGFKHAAEVTRAFQQFAAFAKANGVKQMEYVTRDLVVRYGEHLAERVSHHEIGRGQAQNAVSAINAVMRLATQGAWQRVSPTQDCPLEPRSAIRETPPSGLARATLSHGMTALSERGQAIVELAREFGLRSKESSLLNAQAALRDAQTRGAIRVSEGTKGGRPRDVPLTPQNAARQLTALERAAAVQGTARAVMPADQRWKQWRETGLRAIRETLQQHGIARLHDLRSAYACERYQQLTGHAAPVLGGQAPRGIDRAARWQIAQELGHGRTDITNAYLGAHP